MGRGAIASGLALRLSGSLNGQAFSRPTHALAAAFQVNHSTPMTWDRPAGTLRTMRTTPDTNVAARLRSGIPCALAILAASLSTIF
jgi:hypothetical protein